MPNINVSINVSKIVKDALFEGKTGKWLALTLWETPDGEYGDYRVVQDLGKEARAAGEKGPILGNGKIFGQKPRTEAPKSKAPPRDPDLDPAEDDCPF